MVQKTDRTNEAPSTSLPESPRGFIKAPKGLHVTDQECSHNPGMDLGACTMFPQLNGVVVHSDSCVFPHTLDDGWTCMAATNGAFSLLGTSPLPQNSDVFHGQVPIAALQDSFNPSAQSAQSWFSPPSNRQFSAAQPPPLRGPVYATGYAMLHPAPVQHTLVQAQHPHISINAAQHDVQQQFHGSRRNDSPHMMIHYPPAPLYSAYYPSEYGSYYSAQPPEPFTDYSFAFHPAQPHQIQFPTTSHPNNRHLTHDQALNSTAQHPGFSYRYPPSSHPPPQFFFPSLPPVLLAPPIPQDPVPGSSINHSLPLIDKDVSLPARHSSLSKNSPQNLPSPPVTSIRVARRAHNGSRLTRSALLEDFRSNRDKNWELKDIIGHIVEFSGDQHGSRFIQQQLEQISDEDKEAVFKEVIPNINILVRDVFGNYVIQKFFEFGMPGQITVLATAVEEEVKNLSLDIYGCRVVQKALESISVHQQSSMIQHLGPQILTCIKDANGNHVVQKLIEVVAPDRLTFLTSIRDNMLELSTHPYGCRVLQRCLEHLPVEHTRSLLDAIHCHTVDLMKDQYGNYVIQFILEQGENRDKAIVMASIRGNIIKLSQHKYASNVVEKALMCSDPESREILINEIMMAKPCLSGENPIVVMVKHQYANYVLQRALSLSEGKQRELFFQQVKPLLISLRRQTMTYSRPLVSMERLIDKYFKQSEVL